MQRITFCNVLPDVFTDEKKNNSEVWLVAGLCLEKGKSYLLEAASGTGKSSFCSFIYGQRNDYRGVIRFDDVDIRDFSVAHWDALRRNSLSMLFQELRLFPELTVFENIQLKNNLSSDHGVYRSAEWINNSLELLGIVEKANVLAGKLSYGQQQRVALVRALCQSFDFIFLDEPVSHLDEANSSIVAAFIMDEVKRTGAGMVVTSIGKHPGMQYDKILNL